MNANINNLDDLAKRDFDYGHRTYSVQMSELDYEVLFEALQFQTEHYQTQATLLDQEGDADGAQELLEMAQDNRDRAAALVTRFQAAMGGVDRSRRRGYPMRVLHHERARRNVRPHYPRHQLTEAETY